jgi:hypothetical protein
MSYEKCKYKDECSSYQQDSLKCQFFMKPCLHRIGLEQLEELTDVHLSPKGIEGCLDDYDKARENEYGV